MMNKNTEFLFLFSKMFRWTTSLYKNYRKTIPVPINDQIISRISVDEFKEGDDAMEKFSRTICSFAGYRLYEYQRQLLNLSINLAVPILYYNIWNTRKTQILKRYAIDKLYSIVSTSAPRRDGKSTFLELFAATLLICAPPRKKAYRYGIGYVSINLGASKKVVKDIDDLLNSVDLTQYGIVSKVTVVDRIKVYFKDGSFNELIGFQSGDVSIK
jgi:hypothetical protein